MTLLGAGVAYLYYTPMLRAPLFDIVQNFPFKKTSTCFQAGPVLKKQIYHNTCLLVGRGGDDGGKLYEFLQNWME